MALTLLVILLLLEIGLITMQQNANRSALGEESRLALLLGTADIDANMRTALRSGQASGMVSLEQSIDYRLPYSALKLSSGWGKDSLNNPIAPGWAAPDNIWTPSKAPQLAFEGNLVKKLAKTEVPSGHTYLNLKSSAREGRGGSVSNYSHLFPYGIYAPLGKVNANQVESYSNPTFDQGAEGAAGDEEVPVLDSGRPVDIMAGANLTVKENYRNGRALSVAGPIVLPNGRDKNGAVPVGGYPSQPSLAQAYVNDLKALAQRVGENCTDKTELLDDELFTADHLRQLFSGKADNLISFLGVGQACKVPFFPIPAFQDDLPLLAVFYVMHPFPADFTGGSGSEEDSKRQGEIATEIHEKETRIGELEKQIAEERAKDKPDKKRIDGWKSEASTLADEVADLKKEAQEIAHRKDEEKDDIAAQLSQAKVPTSAAEDGEIRTKGWAYLYLIGDLFNIVIDLLGGHNPMRRIFVPTRVIHLGGNDPNWSWPDGNIDMKGVLTVPAGRTLRIDKPEVKVRGDVHLQAGAVLSIDGNLTIDRPGTWPDFHGAKPSPGETISFPKGRLIMEPGSSVVVQGSLDILGGSYEDGSIMLVDAYGPNSGITQLISAGNDIKARYGMAPGVTMGDLVDDLAKDRAYLKPFNEYFFRPLIMDLAPLIGKLPYIGPWQDRKCWFADYATTFEFIPALEVFGLGGPWPIPLPFDNCLKKVFHYVSVVYQVELNAMLGENFYTMSEYWPFGRGISPIVYKVRSQLLADAFSALKWDKIAIEALESEFEHFVSDVLPGWAIGVFENAIYEILVNAAESAIPFKPPSCGEEKEEEGETKSIKEKAKEFLKEALKEAGQSVKSSFKMVALKMKNEIYKELDGDDERFSNMRELPGALVLAGDEIIIGRGGDSRMALGLFVAGRNVIIKSEKTVGTILALEGDVEVDEFYHYPYFDRASLFNPEKLSLVSSVAQLKVPTGSLGGDFNHNFPRRLAEVWR